ncbi:MAG: hypothetical protein CMF70_08350 [Magnetovibrio sp.]|nr:hypothetical protein [Magnetovibrio sp.]
MVAVVTMDNDITEYKESSKTLKNLEVMSLEALNEYIATLEEEIRRVQAIIAEKELARSVAEKAFKT